MNMHQQRCQLKGCEKSFLKSLGAYIHGRWFCCDEHADQDPETKNLNELIESA